MRFLRIEQNEDRADISKIALGADYFGTNVDRETSFKLLDTFFDKGGNCVDTARIYAQWLPGGKDASEKTLGEWIRSRKNRNKVFLSTKGGNPNPEDMQKGRLSYDCITSDLDQSLLVLQVDHVDLYWLHRDDVHRPVEDIMESLGRIAGSGKVRYIGCSNWKAERIIAANAFASKNNLPRFCMSQIQWSLAASTPEAHGDPTIVCMNDKEYSWYQENKFPVMAYSSQAKGFFAMAASMGIESINNKASNRFLTQQNLSRLERVKQYALESGLSPSSIALGYIMCNRLPAIALVGCKTMEQLADTMTASDINLSFDVVKWLEEDI